MDSERPDAAPPGEVCQHGISPANSCPDCEQEIALKADEAPDVNEDAAPPKEIFLQGGEGVDLISDRYWCQDRIDEADIRYVLASPPSDAAPPENIVEAADRVIDKLQQAATVQDGAAPCSTCGDVPSFLRACSFCGYTAICSAHQHADPTCKTCFGERARQAEDAPGGPCRTCGTPAFADRDEEQWWRQYCALGPELRLELIRYASTLDRLKGDAPTEGDEK